jgi:DNA-binding response OmpR family regulator/DNA-binding CsgD family transcriptional regulator
VPSLLVVDEPRERVEEWRVALETAGYRIVVAPLDDDDAVRLPAAAPDAIVLAAPSSECRAWAMLEALRTCGSALADVPVVVIVGEGALDDALRGAIEGAVRCLAEPLEVRVLVATLDAVLGPGAHSPAEQRRLARQRALAMLARIESRGAASDDDVHPRLVHLTRLEHRPVRPAAPAPRLEDARRRLPTLTAKQRALLHIVEVEGGVNATAARLETSRGNVYAGLRRIVHRLGVRDTGELLRLVGSGDLLRAGQS